jgi:hypothetical protein
MKTNKGNFFALSLQYVNLLSTSNIHPISSLHTSLENDFGVIFLLLVFSHVIWCQIYLSSKGYFKRLFWCVYTSQYILCTFKKEKIKCKTLKKNPRESGWIIRKHNALLDLTNLQMKHEPFAKNCKLYCSVICTCVVGFGWNCRNCSNQNKGCVTLWPCHLHLKVS